MVARPGLPPTEEREATIERWLVEEVGPAYDAMTADPSRALSAQQVFDTLRALHDERMKRSSQKGP
jgi:antitoxin ParD1/3/4